MKSYIIENGVLNHYNGKASQPKIPNGITGIGLWAFANCDNLKNVKIPSSVTSIGYRAFAGCKGLTRIVIPNSVKNIDGTAFAHCINLSSIKIPKSVSYIGYIAFFNIKQVKTQWNANGSLRAFKAFNMDWRCRAFKYKVGKSYHQDGKIQVCGNGFHACANPLDIFSHYWGDVKNLHFAEVELSGEMDWDIDKVAASDIKIVRELSLSELAEIYNSMEKV